MRISALSKACGVDVETIRYWERIGLAPPAPRSPGGDRVYDDTHVRRFVFIRRCRELGFPQEDIRLLLKALESKAPAPSCAEIGALARAHLRRIRALRETYRKVELALSPLAEACTGDSDDCRLPERLLSTAAPRRKS